LASITQRRRKEKKRRKAGMKREMKRFELKMVIKRRKEEDVCWFLF